MHPENDQSRSAHAGATDLMTGFPPTPPGLVTLANWQDPPYNRWAFRRMREVIPTQQIRRGRGNVSDLPSAPQEIDDVTVRRLDGTIDAAATVFAETCTDAVLIAHHGQLVHEWYAPGMRPDEPHLLMSVSKSLVGCVTGVLADRGVVNPAAAVADYVPEIAGTGYDGATVRQLLDMRTGVAFREAYTEPDAEVRVMERSIGWRPAQPGDPIGVYRFLCSLRAAGPHGGTFVYRSADTDLLGWVCERASGTRMADLIAELLWQPLGAEHDAQITCDPLGTGVHDGGVSATARDLLRFGLMLLDNGRLGDRQVVPARWLSDSYAPGGDVRSAFAASTDEPFLPGGWYRNQFWFVPGRHGDLLLCLGIHGQMVHVDRGTGTVAVKLSSWPDPQNAAFLVDTIRAFGAIGTQLAGPALLQVPQSTLGNPPS
jgi:CubicO group peptidase (beta-lactamase class C family)